MLTIDLWPCFFLVIKQPTNLPILVFQDVSRVTAEGYGYGFLARGDSYLINLLRLPELWITVAPLTELEAETFN